MRFEECGECYFYGVEPAMCDDCDDGDNFEPADGDDDSYDQLLELSKPAPIRGKVIMIHPAARQPVAAAEEDEPELCYA